ncbi:MAG: terminase [Sphingobacteriales bacterium]|nr:MAG: terminase [Sphingobacteriales bacterium]
MNRKLTPQKKSAFLAALASTCHVGLACEAADISRDTAYRWREIDERFARSWEKAKEYGADVLEDEAIRRGVHGYDVPVFYEGVIVGTERRYDTKLLTLLLQGARPEKYNMRSFKPEDFVKLVKLLTPEQKKKKDALAARIEEVMEEKEQMKQLQKDIENLV